MLLYKRKTEKSPPVDLIERMKEHLSEFTTSVISEQSEIHNRKSTLGEDKWKKINNALEKRRKKIIDLMNHSIDCYNEYSVIILPCFTESEQKQKKGDKNVGMYLGEKHKSAIGALVQKKDKEGVLKIFDECLELQRECLEAEKEINNLKSDNEKTSFFKRVNTLVHSVRIRSKQDNDKKTQKTSNNSSERKNVVEEKDVSAKSATNNAALFLTNQLSGVKNALQSSFRFGNNKKSPKTSKNTLAKENTEKEKIVVIDPVDNDNEGILSNEGTQVTFINSEQNSSALDLKENNLLLDKDVPSYSSASQEFTEKPEKLRQRVPESVNSKEQLKEEEGDKNISSSEDYKPPVKEDKTKGLNSTLIDIASNTTSKLRETIATAGKGAQNLYTTAKAALTKKEKEQDFLISGNENKGYESLREDQLNEPEEHRVELNKGILSNNYVNSKQNSSAINSSVHTLNESKGKSFHSEKNHSSLHEDSLRYSGSFQELTAKEKESQQQVTASSNLGEHLIETEKGKEKEEIENTNQSQMDTKTIVQKNILQRLWSTCVTAISKFYTLISSIFTPKTKKNISEDHREDNKKTIMSSNNIDNTISEGTHQKQKEIETMKNGSR